MTEENKTESETKETVTEKKEELTEEQKQQAEKNRLTNAFNFGQNVFLIEFEIMVNGYFQRLMNLGRMLNTDPLKMFSAVVDLFDQLVRAYTPKEKTPDESQKEEKENA